MAHSHYEMALNFFLTGRLITNNCGNFWKTTFRPRMSAQAT